MVSQSVGQSVSYKSISQSVSYLLSGQTVSLSVKLIRGLISKGTVVSQSVSQLFTGGQTVSLSVKLIRGFNI